MVFKLFLLKLLDMFYELLAHGCCFFFLTHDIGKYLLFNFRDNNVGIDRMRLTKAVTSPDALVVTFKAISNAHKSHVMAVLQIDSIPRYFCLCYHDAILSLLESLNGSNLFFYAIATCYL